MVHPHHARDSRADGVAARRLGPRGLFAPRWGRTPGAGEDDRAAGRTTRALPWAVALLVVGAPLAQASAATLSRTPLAPSAGTTPAVGAGSTQVTGATVAPAPSATPAPTPPAAPVPAAAPAASSADST
ncbi:MAG: hypothetical protein AVDCRST_MAG07-135, partial [uncultured Frankineae bacterium]